MPPGARVAGPSPRVQKRERGKTEHEFDENVPACHACDCYSPLPPCQLTAVGPHVVIPAGPKPMLLQWTRTRRTFRVNPSTHRRRWLYPNGEGLRTFTMAPL